jgi:hypothetical protein
MHIFQDLLQEGCNGRSASWWRGIQPRDVLPWLKHLHR